MVEYVNLVLLNSFYHIFIPYLAKKVTILFSLSDTSQFCLYDVLKCQLAFDLKLVKWRLQ